MRVYIPTEKHTVVVDGCPVFIVEINKRFLVAKSEVSAKPTTKVNLIVPIIKRDLKATL
jgi:hypothetical protein